MRPVLLGEIFVDDGDFLRGGRVEVVEESPLAQRDLHRFEIVAADDAFVGIDEIFAGGRRASFDGDGTPGEHFAERKRCDRACG